MNDFLEMIERVQRLDLRPDTSVASKRLAHILLDDMAEMMRTRVLLVAANILANDREWMNLSLLGM